MSIELQHIVAATNLLRVAASKGAFQLVQFRDVHTAHKRCVEIVNAVVGEEKADIKALLDEKFVLLLRTVVGISGNKNTGVELTDYDTAYTLVFDVFDRYLRERGAGAGVEEEKEKA